MATTSTTTKVSVWATILAFLITNWSYILLIAGGIFGTIFIVNDFKQKQAINELQRAEGWSDSVSNSKIKYYKDALGNEHARAENLAIHDAAMEAYADSVSKALKIKSDRISTVSNTNGNVHLSVRAVIDSTITAKIPCKTDSVTVMQAFSFHYTDKWAKITGRVGIGTIGQLTFDLPDTLKRVDYWSRKWFLGSKTYYSDLTNTNPYVHITGYKGVTLAGVTDQEKKWSIGPVIAVGYGPGTTFGKPTFFAGVGLTYSVKKF